jgi:hypothetical protein
LLRKPVDYLMGDEHVIGEQRAWVASSLSPFPPCASGERTLFFC